MKTAKPVEAVAVESTHPLYILYTSGYNKKCIEQLDNRKE